MKKQKISILRKLLQPLWVIGVVYLFYFFNQVVFMFLGAIIKIPWKFGEISDDLLFPDFLNYLLLGLLPLLLAFLWAEKAVFRRRFLPRFFPKHPFFLKDITFGLILGPLLFSLLFLAFKSAGWINGIKQDPTLSAFQNSDLFWMVLTFLISAIFEELMYRGLHLPILATGWGLPAGIAFSAFLFSLGHINNPHISFLGLFGIMIAGLFFATAYLVTGTLYLPVSLHFSWNLFQTMFGFKVSGFNLTSLFSLEINGPQLWTGGEFGPEGGLSGIILMVIGTITILVYGKYRSKSKHFSSLLRPNDDRT